LACWLGVIFSVKKLQVGGDASTSPVHLLGQSRGRLRELIPALMHGGEAEVRANRCSSSSHHMASAPSRSMTCAIFSNSMAPGTHWLAAAPAKRRNGLRSSKWLLAVASSTSVGLTRGRSSAQHSPGHEHSTRHASASAKAAANRPRATSLDLWPFSFRKIILEIP
jgi:hypothetical protein